MELLGALLSANLKITKKCPRKISYTFSRKFFLNFGKQNFLLFFFFFSYISENKTFFWKTSYISRRKFPSLKNKKKPLKQFLIFLEIEIFSSKLKKLIFQHGPCKPQKNKQKISPFLYFSEKGSSAFLDIL